MLLRIMPGQVADYWDDIREGLERVLPQGIPDRNARLLYGLQMGDLQVWASFQRGLTPDENVVDGAVVTYVLDEVALKTKTFIIYAVWATHETRPSTWLEGFEALKKFAKSMGCTRLAAYSDDDKILQVARGLRAQTDYTYITWDI